MMTTENMWGMRRLEQKLKDHFGKPTKNAIERIINANVLAVLEVEVRELEKEYDEEMERMEQYFESGRPTEVH